MDLRSLRQERGHGLRMEALGPGGWVYTGIGGVGGAAGDPDFLLTGASQLAIAANAPGGPVANIDNPWTFFGSAGQHGSNGITNPSGNDVDMSGWYVSWNNVPFIDMGAGGTTTITCADANVCADGAGYTLDYATAVPANSPSFPNVNYKVHLEGFVNAPPEVPVPAAVWLFGSGLLGLVGVARRKKAA